MSDHRTKIDLPIVYLIGTRWMFFGDTALETGCANQIWGVYFASGKDLDNGGYQCVLGSY